MRDHVPKQAAKAAWQLVMLLRDVARMLAGEPAIDRARPELGADIRWFVANRYMLFYRSPIGAADIELIRVVHGARDLDAVFSGDED